MVHNERATASQNNPLLTVSVPIGLQFGGPARDIRVQEGLLGSGLVAPGRTLALVGGKVRVPLSLDPTWNNFSALNVLVNLREVPEGGTVGLIVDGNNLRSEFS